jgi:hypothetical protein
LNQHFARSWLVRCCIAMLNTSKLVLVVRGSIYFNL